MGTTSSQVPGQAQNLVVCRQSNTMQIQNQNCVMRFFEGVLKAKAISTSSNKSTDRR